MKPFHLSLILTVVFTSSLSAFQVDSFNLKVGSSYHITSSQSLETSQIIMGAPNTTNIENETLELLEVLEINSNGDYHLKLTTLQQKSVIKSAMMTMVEDSENPEIGSGLFPALKNTHYSFIMNKKGEILEINGLDEVKNTLASVLEGNLQASAQIGSLLNEETIKSTLQLRFSYFPNSTQMEWSNESTMTMNAMPVNIHNNFSYKDNTTLKAQRNLSIDATTTQMGTNVELNLTGDQEDVYTLDETSGIPLNVVSVSNMSGNALAAGMTIPMTIRSESKASFTSLN